MVYHIYGAEDFGMMRPPAKSRFSSERSAQLENLKLLLSSVSTSPSYSHLMPTVVEFSTAQLDLLCGVLRTSGRTVTKTTLAATHDAGAQEVRGVDLYRHDHQTKSRIYYVHRNGKWVPPREHRTKIAYANALVGLAGLVTNWRSSNGEFKKTTRVVVLNKLYINAEMVLKDFDWDGLYGAVFAQRRGDEAAVAAFLTGTSVAPLAGRLLDSVLSPFTLLANRR